MVFNSLAQWAKYRPQVAHSPRQGRPPRQPGLFRDKGRYLQPLWQVLAAGHTVDQLKDADITGITGPSFHTMCSRIPTRWSGRSPFFEEKRGP